MLSKELWCVNDRLHRRSKTCVVQDGLLSYRSQIRVQSCGSRSSSGRTTKQVQHTSCPQHSPPPPLPPLHTTSELSHGLLLSPPTKYIDQLSPDYRINIDKVNVISWSHSQPIFISPLLHNVNSPNILPLELICYLHFLLLLLSTAL